MQGSEDQNTVMKMLLVTVTNEMQGSEDQNTVMKMLLQQNATLMELIKQRELHRNNVNFSIISDINSSFIDFDGEKGPSDARQHRNNVNFSIISDINSSFIDFDGEKGPSDARHWLKKIESSALLHNWPETITFEAARSHLKGAAAAWYKEKDIDSWQEFKVAFTKTFLYERNTTELWNTMRARTQRKDETIGKYFYDKLAACNDLKLSFEETKDQLIVGLYSKDLCELIVGLYSKDLCDFLLSKNAMI
ncbi:Retrotransposon gag protein [Popillia japonica]|uniref:Retrotransposon gag protein n=1 Tax=Popillia japonica TaxID=7064 RepID=A0AAW1NG55_POPJA